MQLPVNFEIARTLPADGCSVKQAEHYTRRLATHHYENFHVASWLLPRKLHQHFYNVYAYCRWADDLGDEAANPSQALELLAWWERELNLCCAGAPVHPVFVALAPTIRAFDIPSDPFHHLLAAFRQDQTVDRYSSWGDLLEYCQCSANPVGRLVLYLCGYRDAQRQKLSDSTCTALQLANFWQDVSRDLDKGRIYIPLDALERHGLEAGDIVARRFDARTVALMKDLIARTRALFAAGAPLSARVEATMRVDLDLFSQGGLAILDAIERMGYNTLERRPVIRSMTRVRLLGHAVAGRVGSAFAGVARNVEPGPIGGRTDELHGTGSGDRETRESQDSDQVRGQATEQPKEKAQRQAHDPKSLATSFGICRHVARSAASNFYYAFYMLPRPKRNALCALYAFMRLVDDVSDTPRPEGEPGRAGQILEKRAALARWRILLDQAVSGDTSGHPILPAFADTVRRYGIPSRYFHDLLSGAEMDLTEMRYATFDRLHEYCYRVAGTVGLTCLHVFGSEDPHAPEMAEQLGVAFQLTNILRDVGADLAMGRIYLPSEDLARFGCSTEDLARGIVTFGVRELLRKQADRAWRLYGDGAGLIPQIDRDSRAALWALVRIYSTLLARIERRDFDVFSARVRLTSAEKTRVLLRARLGWWSEGDVLEERDRDRRRARGAFLGRRAG